MKKLLILIAVLSSVQVINAQSYTDARKDLSAVFEDISKHYVYFSDRHVDPMCLQDVYPKLADSVQTKEQGIAFFESFFQEFGDDHVRILDTDKSYVAPVIVLNEQASTVIMGAWSSEYTFNGAMLPGAEVSAINGVPFQKAIDEFASKCLNKNHPEARNWIANKLLAENSQLPRKLSLKGIMGDALEIDLDTLQKRTNDGLISSKIESGIGYLRINDALQNPEVIAEFDKSMATMVQTNGLILDLRNTPSGGDGYIARGILGHFVSENTPYQVYTSIESHEGSPPIERIWTEYVAPRQQTYSAPVIVLVGYWTSGIAEGLTTGLQSVSNAKVMGSNMMRLSGETEVFTIPSLGIQYQLPVRRAYLMNGIPREQFVSGSYFMPTTVDKDELLDKAMRSF